jgi:hypothetical protein
MERKPMTDIPFRGTVPILGGATVRTQDATPQDVINAYIARGMMAYAQHLAEQFNAVAAGQEAFEVAKAALLGMGIPELRRASAQAPNNGGDITP